jgi:hypothetical protein
VQCFNFPISIQTPYIVNLWQNLLSRMMKNLF